MADGGWAWTRAEGWVEVFHPPRPIRPCPSRADGKSPEATLNLPNTFQAPPYAVSANPLLGQSGSDGQPRAQGGGSMLYKEMLSPASRGCGDGVRRRTGGPGRSVCLVLYSASTTQSWQHLLRRSFPCWRRSHHSWRPHEGSGRPPPQPRSALQTPRSRTRVHCKPASRLRQTRRIRRTEPLTRFHSVSLSN